MENNFGSLMLAEKSFNVSEYSECNPDEVESIHRPEPAEHDDSDSSNDGEFYNKLGFCSKTKFCNQLGYFMVKHLFIVNPLFVEENCDHGEES